MIEKKSVFPWDRRDNEPALWYNRFEIFRRMGPWRSIDGAYRKSLVAEGKVQDLSPEESRKRRSGVSWNRRAKQDDWVIRAEAWDAYERERFERSEESRVAAARQRRLEASERIQRDVLAAIDNAKLSELKTSAAREALGELRRLLVDMINIERVDHGEVLAHGVDDEELAADIKAMLERVYGAAE